MLRGPFLCMGLRKVMSDDAAAYRARDCVVTRIVSRDTADDRALQAAGGVGRSGCRQCQTSSRGKCPDTVIEVHVLSY